MLFKSTVSGIQLPGSDVFRVHYHFLRWRRIFLLLTVYSKTSSICISRDRKSSPNYAGS